MLKKWLRSPLVTAALLVVSVGFIVYGGIHGAQAALTITSKWFGAEVVLDDIDVALTEQSANDSEPSKKHGDDDLLTTLLKNGEEFVVGRKYDNYRLAVRNTANDKNNQGGADGNAGNQLIKEYVRVTVYKYWTKKDAEGNYVKAPELDPKKIDLVWDTSSGWSIDEDSTTDERTVLYYSEILYKDKDTTPFTKSIRVDSSVLDDDAYDGARFKIEAVVDAVQTHNGKDAMMSAWGNNLIAVGDDAEN